MPPLPVFIGLPCRRLVMDMSFQRHASFELGKEKPDQQSGQPLDYARLIALAQKSTAQQEKAAYNDMLSVTENSCHIISSQDGDIQKRIALIVGAGQSHNSDARSTGGCGAFLQRPADTGCGPDQHDANAKSKSPVYLDHLANRKASDVKEAGKQDQS